MSRHPRRRPPCPIASIVVRDLSDQALVDHYVACKNFAYIGAQIRDPNLGVYLKHIDLAVAFARKRGIKLPV